MKTAKKELLKIVAVAAAGVIAGTGVTAATIGAAKKTDAEGCGKEAEGAYHNGRN